MALSHFREAKTAEEEVNLVRNAVPKSTLTRINGHMEYLKSGKGSDWLKNQLLRLQVYLKPMTFIKLSRWIHLWIHH